MSAFNVIQVARQNAHKASMRSSALLCVADAEQLAFAGFIAEAKARALRSLEYSVGVLSTIYREAAA